MLDQIERLMAAMRQVTDNIAHDLRSPLGRLRARIEVTLLEEPSIERYHETLQTTIIEADGLLATFSALLDIAEAEAGSRREAMAPVDLAEVVRDLIDLYEPVAEEKGLRLDLAFETPGPLSVVGNRHLLNQAISNLIENALKYTPAGGAVLVTAGQHGDTIRLSVTDSGPGIPKAARERVFDRFYRLESSRTTPGNGLGLSLVKAVVGLHGGSIGLSEAPTGTIAAPANDAVARRSEPEAPTRSESSGLCATVTLPALAA
jgi:signal transduction histidine kinase